MDGSVVREEMSVQKLPKSGLRVDAEKWVEVGLRPSRGENSLVLSSICIGCHVVRQIMFIPSRCIANRRNFAVNRGSEPPMTSVL